jgi:hypothetical protein
MGMPLMSEGTEHHLEHAEHTQHAAHNPFDRGVAMTMAIMAAMLAGITLVSHRGHTETLHLATEASSLRTQESDMWNLYQAKNIRSHEYESFLLLEELLTREGVKPDAETKTARAYWIRQLDKYQGAGYWQAFKEAVKASKEPSWEPKGQLAKHSRDAQDLQARAEKYHHRSDEVHALVAYVDYGHLGLELALVMCAVAVLTKQKPFWMTGIGFAVIALAVAAYGMFGLWTLPPIDEAHVQAPPH